MAKEAIRDFSGKILGWVETSSNGDKVLRDFPGRILGKYTLRIEGKRSVFVIRIVDFQIVQLFHLLKEVCAKLFFISMNLIKTDAHQIFRRRSGTDHTLDIGSTGFKAHRRVLKQYGCVRGETRIHIAAHEHRRHILQQFPFAIEDADAVRSAHLVRGKAEEIAAELFDINLHMRNRLSPVHHDISAIGMGDLSDFSDRLDTAEHIGDLGQ